MSTSATKTEPDSRKRETGTIEPGVLYTAAEARRRLQLRDWAWRSMRRDGLEVLRYGGRSYVLGSSLIEFLTLRSGNTAAMRTAPHEEIT